MSEELNNTSFAEMIENSMKKINIKQVVKGTVVNINRKGEVIVDIGYKSDGIIPKDEYSYNENANPKNDLKIGDTITAEVVKMNDGEGNVLLSTKRYKMKDVKKELEDSAESNVKVTIFQGLPKAEKMELVIQKSVELGVFDITPVEMKRCIVKLKEKDKEKKLQRWQKISEVAAKQCGRNIIPKINTFQNLKNICQNFKEYDIVLVCYENEKEKTLKQELKKIIKENKKNVKIAIVIGPEGGIEKEEVEIMQENGAKVITLGKRILRTETVALNVLSVIMYELEN